MKKGLQVLAESQLADAPTLHRLLGPDSLVGATRFEALVEDIHSKTETQGFVLLSAVEAQLTQLATGRDLVGISEASALGAHSRD